MAATESTNAAPSAVGKYGGISADGGTFVSFDSTRRGIIRNLEIAGLRAICTTSIPGNDQLPSEERSTNISKAETPSIRLRNNGEFSSRFFLTDRGRVDFRGARIRITGNLRNNRGRIKIILTMDQSYEDGSTESCGGSATIRVQLART